MLLEWKGITEGLLVREIESDSDGSGRQEDFTGMERRQAQHKRPRRARDKQPLELLI